MLSVTQHRLLTASAKLGIGTTSPSQALSVVGNIAVTGTVDGVNVSAHAAATAAHGATGAVVGTTNTQTLTNKNIQSQDIQTAAGAIAAGVGVTTNFTLPTNSAGIFIMRSDKENGGQGQSLGLFWDTRVGYSGTIWNFTSAGAQWTYSLSGTTLIVTNLQTDRHFNNYGIIKDYVV